MGRFKALKRKLGKGEAKKAERAAAQQGRQNPLRDPLLGDGDVSSVQSLQTGSTAG